MHKTCAGGPCLSIGRDLNPGGLSYDEPEAIASTANEKRPCPPVMASTAPFLRELLVPDLEQEDRIDTEGRLVVAFVQTGDHVVIPVPADLGTNQNVGVRFNVHTQGQGVDVGFVTEVTEDTFLVVPFETSTCRDAIAERVDQVLVDADGVSHTGAVLVLGIQVIALEDVLQTVGDGNVGDDRVHVALFGAAVLVGEPPCNGRVDQADVFGDGKRSTAQERITVVLESAVPTQRVTAVDFQVVADRQRSQHTGVREGFAVVHRVRVTVEEVVGCRDDFPSDDGIKVTDFDGEVSVARFHVQLRQRVSIIRTVVPVVIPVIVIDPKGLGVLGIGTVDVIDSSTDIETRRSVDRFLGPQPSLMKLEFIGTAVEQRQRVVVVSHLNPTASRVATVLAEQREGLAQITFAEQATQAAAATAIGLASRIASAVIHVSAATGVARTAVARGQLASDVTAAHIAITGRFASTVGFTQVTHLCDLAARVTLSCFVERVEISTGGVLCPVVIRGSSPAKTKHRDCAE